MELPSPTQDQRVPKMFQRSYPEFDFVFFFFGLHRHVLLFHLLHLLGVDLQTEGQSDDHLRVSLELGRHVLLEVLQLEIKYDS